MTPRAPPTKNSSFCSTEGAGAQPGPGSVAEACGGGRAWWRLGDPLSAPGYRAGAAATGKCQADGLGVRGLISAEHSCWLGRKRERCVVCSGWSRSP